MNFPGIYTGPLHMHGPRGEKLKWVPLSDLVLVSNQDIPDELPQVLARNPGPTADDLIRIMDEGPSSVESGRFLIGFNVGLPPVYQWRAGQIFLLFMLLRENQLRESGLGTGFSFWSGLGAYAPQKSQATVENSAQIVLANLSDPPQDRREFKLQMLALSGQIAEYLSQDSVWLELTEEGRVVFSRYVHADPNKVESPETIQELLEQNKSKIDPNIWELR